MKVVLLKDVAGVGARNDIKDVSDGYALNFLIPKKFAVFGTPAAIAHAERMKAEQAKEREIQESLLLKNLSSLAGVTITLSGKASDKGHLFGGIHKEAIAEAIKKEARVDIPPESIELLKPIKEVGEHKVHIRVKDKIGVITLIIAAEQS